MGYATSDIEKYAELAIQNTTDPFRIEVFNTMISIARSVCEKKSVTNT